MQPRKGKEAKGESPGEEESTNPRTLDVKFKRPSPVKWTLEEILTENLARKNTQLQRFKRNDLLASGVTKSQAEYIKIMKEMEEVEKSIQKLNDTLDEHLALCMELRAGNDPLKDTATLAAGMTSVDTIHSSSSSSSSSGGLRWLHFFDQKHFFGLVNEMLKHKFWW